MKRLFTLLSLLLLVVGTGMAQRILSIGDEVTDGNFNTHDHYVIKLVSYNDGTNTVNVENDNKYLYTSGNNSRFKADALTINTSASTNYLVNMQDTGTEGVYTLGLGFYYMPSFITGTGGFSSVTNRSASEGVYGFKFIKQEGGGYYMQGYRGSNAGLYLKYNGSETQVTDNTGTNAMLVKVYKVNTNVEEGKFYNLTLRQKSSGNRYVVLDNGLFINSQSAKSTSTEGVWFFKKKSEALGQWYVYNAYAGDDYPLYATTDNNSRVTLESTGSAFTVKDGNTDYISGNGFSLVLNGNATINDVSGALGIWNDGKAPTDGGSSFIATELSDAYVPCTFTYTDATNNITMVRHTYQKVGEAPTVPTIGYFTASTESSTLTNVSADSENSYTINGTFAFPFTISKDNADTWYALRVRLEKSSGCDVVVNGSNINSRVSYSNVATTYDRFYDGLFKFIQSGSSEYFKIKTHSGSYLKFIRTTASGNSYNMRDLTTTSNESEASDFMISHSNYSGAADSEFKITPIFSNTTSTYVVGDHNSGNLTVWSGNKDAFKDDGSRFAVKAADATTDILTIGAKAKANDLANAVPNTYIGGYTDAAINSFKTASYSSLSDLETKATEFTQSESNMQKPIEGKMYRISFTRGTQHISESNALASNDGTVYSDDSHAENRRIRLADDASNTATLIQFEPHDSYYYIKGINSGLYWGTEKDCNTFDPNSPTATNSPKLMAVSKTVGDTWMGHYAIDYTTSGTAATIGLKDLNISESKGQYLFSPYETVSAGAANNNNICFHAATASGSTTFEPGCAIKIQQVTTYPLTISAAGYASLCLPFSVTLPEGLTAYKVTGVADGGESRAMTMVALTGAVPAEEPIIVSGTAGTTYQLTINDADGTKSTDNILTGATVKRTGITEDYFALGYKALDASDADTKTAGFYKVTTQTMPANKAYLLRSRIPANTQQAAVLLFNFNGETTGIDAATTTTSQTEDNTLYDLNGRRVIYPTRGIYVRGNGQKVFIR